MRPTVRTLWILIGLAWAVTPPAPAEAPAPAAAPAQTPREAPTPQEITDTTGLEAAQAACTERAARTPAYALTMEIRQVFAADERRIETLITRRVEAVRLEQRWHYRMEDQHETRTHDVSQAEQDASATRTQDGSAQTGSGQAGSGQVGRSLVVNDGRFVWIMHEVAGQRSAVRMRFASEWLPLADSDYFHTLRSDAGLVSITTEELDGRPVWVIRLQRRPDFVHGLGLAVRERRYIDQDTCLQRLVIGEDADGQVVYEARTTHIERDPAFAINHFRFAPPAGAYVADLTRESEPAEAGPAPPTIH